MSDVINAHDLGIAGGYITEAAMQQDIDQLKAENAKLRELLASTISNYADAHMDDTGARYPCDLCDASSMQQCDYQQDKQCQLYRHLRERGVEVN